MLRMIRRLPLALIALLAVLLSACGGAPTSTMSPAPTAGTTSNVGGSSAPPMPAATQAAPQVAGAVAPASADSAAREVAAGELAPSAQEPAPQPQEPAPVEVNPYTRASDDNLSTFAMDVDTAAFSASRRYLLENGSLPPADMVRVEEFVNALDYGYAQPEDVFGVSIDAAPAPFLAANSRLVRVGIQGMSIDDSQRMPAALTFVIDISGSMAEPARLPLVKQSLTLLVEQLREGDTVAIVAYGSRAFSVLDPTPATEREAILKAIGSLQNEGSTNAEEGLRMAYEVAGRAFQRDASNRVILCSDGVANVGATGPEAILNVIRDRAAQGIYLTTVGFGLGDYNDQMMEQLADDGNGSYAYVDTIDEARRIFVENLTGTLQVIAKDAKIQVEFNPEVVSQYRLLGYENRAVADADFRNDKVDAGEVGAGHSVTALYEVVLTEQGSGEALKVSLRWADPQSGEVRELSQPFASDAFGGEFAAAPASMRLAAAAAALAEHLRGSPYAQSWDLADVSALLGQLAAEQPNNAQIQELRQMADRAAALGA
ncbi:von Willebrand factor type A domain-containing protein [Oscillochloris sp. ZM17-4]|uniref:vWA domain-containing protein n=1 Tax=Oscillochloris sp. ZM17-4 TaxID=2866714 RepID=UPI001C73B66A|nr:von Willebrand factor type A domain-containing protein [Oscillochloris sp. ZM17-4]MBX0329457.1 von Willebrand factor type A domain-containing protein [Oscillochloris sp. ZM17-4]